MENNLVRNEIVIDWKHVFFSVLKKWWLILLCLIIGATSGYVLGTVADKPVYECQIVYVLSYSGGDSVSQMASEYSFLNRILYNCTEVLKQNTFAGKVAYELNKGLSEESPNYIPTEEIQKCVSYTYDTKGTMVYVSVDTESPSLSYKITSAVIELLPEHIKEEYHLAGIDSMVFSLVNTPELPEEPVESRVRFNFTLLGAAAFALLTAVIVAFIAMADTRIKKEDDLKNRFNAPILGTIPNFFDPAIQKGGYHQYGTKK